MKNNTFKFDRGLLVSKLGKAIKFVPSKIVIPAWDNFRMSITDNVMEIIASDGNMQIRMFCPVESKGNFEICVDASLLLKTISLFKENSVTITQKTEKKIELKSGKSKYNITVDCFPENFSVMPMEKITSEISVSQFMLKMALKSSASFVDEKHPNANFTAINIAEVNNKIVFLATSNALICRVAVAPISINSWLPVNISPEISKKVVSLLSDKGEIAVVHSGDKVRFFTNSEAPDHYEVTSVTSNIKFPPAEKFFAKIPESSICFNTIEVKDAIKRLSLYTAIGADPEVHISNAENPQEIKLTNRDSIAEKNGEEFISIINPNEAVINKKFNNERIINLLSEIDAAETNIFFTDSNTNPSLIVPKVNTPEEDIYSFLISSIA